MDIVLNPLNPVVKRPAWLRQASILKSNYGIINHRTSLPYTNSILENIKQVPVGVLAGSVATIDSSTGYYKECVEETDKAVGIFALNSHNELASNQTNRPLKMTVYSGGFYAVTIYETFSEFDGVTPLVYTPGDYLYVSSFGFLTSENNTGVNNNIPVAIVEKQPTDSSPEMIIKLSDFPLPVSGAPAGTLMESDIVDNVTSTDVDKPLSANMGKFLFDSLSSNLFKTAVYKMTAGIVTQGYVNLGFTPLYKQHVVVFVKSGSIQLNYWSENYTFADFGIADFAIGDKNGLGNLDRLYFRSDGGLGGYTNTDLVDGSVSPGLLPTVGSTLIVLYQE